MNRLKVLATETAIYGVSSILGRMLNWLLVPLYTQFLIPSEYGIVTELYAYVAFLVILYTFGLETAYFRFSSKEAQDEKTVFNQAQSMLVISSVVISSLLILFSTPIVNYLEYPGRERYIVWFAIILAIDAISAIPFAKLRLQRKAKRFAFVKLTNIFVNIILNLFFLVFCTQMVKGETDSQLKDLILTFYNERYLVDYVFISNLIANALLLLLLGDIIFRTKVIFTKTLLRKMYYYSIPIMIMGLAGVTNEMLSRAVLKKWLPDGFYEGYSNQAALGIFGAVYKLSVFMTLAIQAFRYAAEPFFFSRSGDLDSKELFSKVMHWFIIFSSLILILISLNLDIIGKVFLRSPAYREGLYVVPVLLLANLFLGVYYNLSVWFKLTDKTYYGTFISISGAVITILLNYLLIPVIGYLGSALATLICYFFMSSVSYLLGRQHYRVPYQVRDGFIYILFASGLTYLGYYRNPILPADNKLTDILLILFFLIIVTIIERKHIKRLLRKKEYNENKDHK